MKRKRLSRDLKHESSSQPRTSKSLLSRNDSSTSRECAFGVREKVIGYYGGWPYVGVVQAIGEVEMTFGKSFVLQIKWNGFSGKNATTWTSEFDVVKHVPEKIQMKEDMERSRREKLKDVVGKVDTVKQRRIFLKVVEEFRGKKLAPLAPPTCPYAEEWQTIVRIACIPSVLIDHLAHSEGLINERKLVIGMLGFPNPIEVTTVDQALSRWASGESDRLEYVEIISEMFNKFFIKLLLYRFEIAFVTREIARQGCCEYSIIFSVEYLLRLFVLLPQLLTAACEGVLFRGIDNVSVKSLFGFCSLHQSFMSFLELDIESLVRAPARQSTLDQGLAETHWMEATVREKGDEVDTATEPSAVEGMSTTDSVAAVTTVVRASNSAPRSKRKSRVPVHKPGNDQV